MILCDEYLLDCSHKFEREEEFNVLSVEMKSTMSILKNLEWYVQGELLDGDNKYMCETCTINGLSWSGLAYLIRKTKGWPCLKHSRRTASLPDVGMTTNSFVMISMSLPWVCQLYAWDDNSPRVICGARNQWMGINQHNTWIPPFWLAMDIYSHFMNLKINGHLILLLAFWMHPYTDNKMLTSFFNILMNKPEEALEHTSENDLVRRIFVGLFS